jgi:unspecific monooxygenase
MPTLDFPGPTEPATDQVRRWVEEPTRFWEECALRYGPLVSLNLGSIGPAVLVSDPECLKGIFQLPRDSFEVRHYNEHYRYVMGERSVLVRDGDDHHRHKPPLSAPLRREPVLPHGDVIRRLAREMADRWPAGEAFAPRPYFHDMAFQVVVHLTFGDLAGDPSRALVKAYRDSVVPSIGGSWGPWQNFRRLHPQIARHVAVEAAARRADPDRPGLLTHLTGVRFEDGSGMSDEDLSGHVITLMLTGVDTTSIALAWSLYWLTHTPSALARVVSELDSRPDDTLPVLLDRPYLHAVFQETLRMYPVVPTPSGRRLTRDMEIAGHHFPAGVTLIPCSYLAHRREAVFPEAARFKPERFLDRVYDRHDYFPFGGGQRMCVGQHLSQIDFKIVLAAVLAQWNLESADTGPVTPVRHGTMLAPSAEFRIRVTPRARPPESAGHDA